MRVSIRRLESTDEGTFGLLTMPGFRCYTMELPWRNNARRVSCIPTGTYRAALTQSPRFGRVYLLQAVPGRSAILIHPANVAGDKVRGFDSQLEGCIALGERIGALRNSAGRLQRAVLVSRPAVRAFMAATGGQPITLEIT